MIQVSDQLYQFYHQMTQNQGVQTEKSVQEVNFILIFIENEQNFVYFRL